MKLGAEFLFDVGDLQTAREPLGGLFAQETA